MSSSEKYSGYFFIQYIINGCISLGHDRDKATKVYDLILKFASYGFNRAHSVSYAMIAYRIAYLKVHYPLVFMKELLCKP